MSEELKEIALPIDDMNDSRDLFGINDIFLKRIEEALETSIITRGEKMFVTASKKDIVESIVNALLSIIQKGHRIQERDVIYALQLAKNDNIEAFAPLFDEVITKNIKGKQIRAKTIGQKKYIDAIKKFDLVFGIGPAGTGKTYLAVVKAVDALKKGEVEKIILTRPAVEAGESLGFLPGDFKEKVDPYLRPLYDGLHDILGKEHTARLIEREVIEIAPLAYMRGRTLDNAFVILDEAQNTTPEQMKMFLTRLGFGSKMVITGDDTQVDLPKGLLSGLSVATKLLNGIKGISFVFLESTDVVRHPLVQKIIKAYNNN